MTTTPLNAAVYAKSAQQLADFYAQVLALSRADEGDSFVWLASADVELAIVQVPATLANAIVMHQPPQLREQTAIKLSFLVADIEALRPLIERLGGGLKDVRRPGHGAVRGTWTAGTRRATSSSCASWIDPRRHGFAAAASSAPAARRGHPRCG